jgi:ankyrin repeat protein
VNTIDGEGIAALHWAAINNRQTVVEFLLQSGADINCAGGELKSTPIYWATSQGHVDMVVLLYDRGADATQPDSNGHNCLFLAAQLENWKLLLLFGKC